ncbi:hypothetical protein C1646_818267 [Rhizophagus diaphanus]|nr:hypothetical protein C1646_818267 [Rhizophagus diaphanus] [Rhizophagus sp. MUCL 43196]
MATYETNINNNNVYEEDVDNSSETSKENYSSSASSFVDESKKINFEDSKEGRNLSSSKRKKRNSFISMFNPKKDDEKEKHSEGLVRTLSGIFNKDKDNNKRNNTVESEKQVRPTSRTSSNSDASKHGHGYIFFSDDDEKPENDTTLKKGTKYRQNSNAENLEKDKSSKKAKRISVNLGKFFDNKSSPKPQDIFENSFLEPAETMPKKNKNSNDINKNSNNNNNNNNDNDNVESPQIGNGTDNVNNHFPPKSTDDSPVDDVQSTISSTQQSSFDDQEISSNNNVNNKHESEYNSGSPTTPITPRLIVTPTEPESAPFEFITKNSNKVEFEEFEDEKDDQVDQNNAVNSIIRSKPYEGKERNYVPLTISTNNIKPNSITNTIEQQGNGYGSNNTKTLQELEEINKSLNNVKEQLEAKVAEKDVQINKFNSMENIMQQQIDLSKRMTETMQRLESKVNVQKDEVDGTSVSKMFEETIKRLETKIDRQNDEIINLKSIVGQLCEWGKSTIIVNKWRWFSIENNSGRGSESNYSTTGGIDSSQSITITTDLFEGHPCKYIGG